LHKWLLSVFIVFELKNLNSLQTFLAIGFCPADGKSCQKNLPFQIYFIDIAIIKRCKRKKANFWQNLVCILQEGILRSSLYCYKPCNSPFWNCLSKLSKNFLIKENISQKYNADDKNEKGLERHWTINYIATIA